MPIGTTEIIIIALVVVLLFGAGKLPTIARSIGQSMRIFKAETKAMSKEDEAERQAPQQPAPQQYQAPTPLPPAQPVQQQPAPQVAPPLEQQPRTDNR